MTPQPSKARCTFSSSNALLDCKWIAQAAQVAHARCFKPLKLTGPTTSTKERVEPDWRRLWKEDPVRFMALYKADYMHTIRRQVHGTLQADYRHNVKWTKARASRRDPAVGEEITTFFCKTREMTSLCTSRRRQPCLLRA